MIGQDAALEEDNAVREGIKELQSAGPDNLEAGELEELVQMLYQIQGKLSYILSLFETLHRWGTARKNKLTMMNCSYRSSREGSQRRLDYAVSGCSLALNIHGPGSPEVAAWRNRIDVDKYIYC